LKSDISSKTVSNQVLRARLVTEAVNKKTWAHLIVNKKQATTYINANIGLEGEIIKLYMPGQYGNFYYLRGLAIKGKENIPQELYLSRLDCIMITQYYLMIFRWGIR
jgi:hypothetical protein